MKKLPIILILITIVLSACGAPAPVPTAVPPTAVPPTATPAFTATPQPTATQEAASAIEPIPGFVEVTDDTGSLTLQVPSEWTEVNGVVSNESLWQNIGFGIAEITVSSSLDALKNEKAPGVIVMAVAGIMDTSAALDALKASLKNCQSADSLPPREKFDEKNIEGFVELIGCPNSVMFISAARQKTGSDALILVAFTAPLSEDPATMTDIFGKIISSIEIK